MSKRYGRNQKRAHRAQIAALTEAHERESKLAAHLGREVRSLRHEMEEWDDEIARLLGEYSAFRRQTPVVESRQPMREIPIMPRRHTMSYVKVTSTFSTVETYIRERMFRFISYCQTDDIQMRRIVRLIEHDGRTDEWAYSVSEPMLRAGFDNREIEYLSQQIARAFVAAFNRKRKEAGFVRA